MGFYIEGPVRGKAQFLRDNYSASLWKSKDAPEWEEIDNSEAIICVVDNGIFEAAGYCYNPRELEAFARPDGRLKAWLLMDKQKAEELTGYKPLELM